ncbi:isochorismatase family protein [Aquabacter spiritensis]|uniref:Nicotinamidase-related amidase n=1 Tax=Aquabacter spiritensis TaxID=933073 RepID=A0A4R3LYL3_9HYPH|nr:isochorismatase family protein [Aquabacter spiritensis]TCT03855.1 nicotinamidase-related amidase [Aquabacter spiritensis]
MALLSPTQSVLLVIDIQERLAAVIPDAEGLVARTGILLQAARHLGVPALAFEQYPRGLGGTLPAVSRHLPDGAIMEKMAFSVAAIPAVRTRLATLARRQIVIAGLEAHICVLQSAFGLKAAGYDVHVVADAVGARRPRDVDLAFARLRMEGIGITNCEMAVYEWMRHAETPHFKTMSRLLRG